ncbi:serine/threonine protein kinase [Chloropicon primus]|uniref:Serine/threonine protein kinase n=1 Tax=Chloropicon primus TaxID=1764295 RepID=A0A5B8MZY6_9CHLO|nr:serine/threonine protein kinase [Chloropicon primus]UPR04783.1 serine/threonine protein kinase [Chloropicon primus]|eukprot:QDZ25586.1 serine/threonine protein kinase [Chloropicon primus]
MKPSVVSDVEKLPYEGDGAFTVQGDMWKVGKRYELIRSLGKGSFSVVCLARDLKTGELVALKKIKDVFVHKNNAKNVIREVYIQRRLRHPNIVELRDLFMMPSPTGKWKMVGGKLVTDSVDLYLVLEYIDGGDLFHMSDQLNDSEVKHIIDQLLLAVQFLHSSGVIHRDIKSANILIKTDSETGKRTVKLADFGCARVASNDSTKNITRNKSYEALPDDEQAGSSDSHHQMRSQMTTAVATPCYRAPEVVMALESYTSKVDVWSLGCILAELLARLLSNSKAYCKHLRVLPLFNLSSQPKLFSGVSWDDGEGATMAHRELRTVFEVVGTPAWHLVNKISDQRWKSFLMHLPGHAPTLGRRFQGISEVCLDLLRRMLEFDPETRCGATEALTHEYLRDDENLMADATIYGEFNVLHSKGKEAFDKLEMELDTLLKDEDDTHSLKLKRILELEIEELRHIEKDSWKPVEISTPQPFGKRLNLGKSAPVLSSYPYDNTAQMNMVGQNAHEEMTKSYHDSFQPGSPVKKTLFLDGRHKDWTTNTSCTVEPHWLQGKKAEPVWGVTKKIPGMDNEDDSNKIVSQQQSR